MTMMENNLIKRKSHVRYLACHKISCHKILYYTISYHKVIVEIVSSPLSETKLVSMVQGNRIELWISATGPHHPQARLKPLSLSLN